jgi:dTDP-4-dehydrorhamnose reductase
MTTKHILLLGANGQIGQALRAETLPSDWELRAFGRAELDITNHRAVQHEMQSATPDLVINAAAMTAVDACETDHDAAMRANFEAPGTLAALCAALDVPLIHLSTDYVFDGSEGDIAYPTDAPMNPLGVYGHTKMMGEEAIRHEHAWHVILRVSSVFSEFGNNLLTKAIQNIETRDELKIVTDQKSCPTYAPDIAKVLITITDKILHGQHNGYGTFHYCGTPAVTRLEFVTAIMAAYAPHTDKRPKITPALSADFPGFAQRPAFSALDCTKIRDVYGIEQRDWREGLGEAILKCVNR